MLGVNVVAADTDAEARRLFTSLQQAFVALRRGPPGRCRRPSIDRFEAADLPSREPSSNRRCHRRSSARPTPSDAGLSDFLARTGADELIIAAQIFDHAARLRSYEIVAETRQSAVVNRQSSVTVDNLSR